MAEDLVFYTNPQSRGRIARWMLEETGVPYRTELLGYGGTMKSAEYLAVNPMGKVPAIVHGGAVVTECAAICAYLADAFPDAGLAPEPKARAAYYRWLFFGAGPVEAAVTNKACGFVADTDKAMMLGYGSFDDTMKVLEAAVSGPGWIAGPEFSAADVYVGSAIGWGLQFGTMEKLPAFEAYFARLAERPAFKRATELDDAAAAEMGM